MGSALFFFYYFLIHFYYFNYIFIFFPARKNVQSFFTLKVQSKWYFLPAAAWLIKLDWLLLGKMGHPPYYPSFYKHLRSANLLYSDTPRTYMHADFSKLSFLQQPLVTHSLTLAIFYSASTKIFCIEITHIQANF